MPCPKNAMPKYRHHKISGRAVVPFIGTDFYLGRYNSSESRARYLAALLTGYQENGFQSPGQPTSWATSRRMA